MIKGECIFPCFNLFSRYIYEDLVSAQFCYGSMGHAKLSCTAFECVGEIITTIFLPRRSLPVYPKSPVRPVSNSFHCEPDYPCKKNTIYLSSQRRGIEAIPL